MATIYNGVMIPAEITADALSSQGRHARWAGVAASLLLHVGVATLLVWSPEPEFPPPPETMVIEMLAMPAPEPPAPAPPPPPPEPPAMVQQPPPAILPPPPPPQLSEAPIAEKSSPPPAPVRAPPRERPAARAPRPSPEATPVPPRPQEQALVVPRSTPLEAGRGDSGGGAPGSVASQSVQDFILAQIARHWLIDVRGPRFRNIVLFGQFVLLPNGMLAPPHGKNDPWDPRAMIKDYDKLRGPAGEALRSALETFLLATRQAQPFKVPPDGDAREARALPLRFRLGDL